MPLRNAFSIFMKWLFDRETFNIVKIIAMPIWYINLSFYWTNYAILYNFINYYKAFYNCHLNARHCCYFFCSQILYRSNNWISEMKRDSVWHWEKREDNARVHFLIHANLSTSRLWVSDLVACFVYYFIVVVVYLFIQFDKGNFWWWLQFVPLLMSDSSHHN